MAIARWKDLCLDSGDVETSARFWAAALGLEVRRRPGQVWLSGPTPQHTVWINAVPEPHTAKNRVHLDVHTAAVTDLEQIGALRQAELPRWTVMTDPDGQEFCAFVRDRVPAQRLYELVVDCADPDPISRWWAGVFGVQVQHDPPATGEDDDWWVVPPDAPFDGIVFGAVPEPKTVKNRVHWDVTGQRQALLDAGATMLRAQDREIAWDVMADPDGNEFCRFDEPA